MQRDPDSPGARMSQGMACLWTKLLLKALRDQEVLTAFCNPFLLISDGTIFSFQNLVLLLLPLAKIRFKYRFLQASFLTFLAVLGTFCWVIIRIGAYCCHRTLWWPQDANSTTHTHRHTHIPTHILWQSELSSNISKCSLGDKVLPYPHHTWTQLGTTVIEQEGSGFK